MGAEKSDAETAGALGLLLAVAAFALKVAVTSAA